MSQDFSFMYLATIIHSHCSQLLTYHFCLSASIFFLLFYSCINHSFNFLSLTECVQLKRNLDGCGNVIFGVSCTVFLNKLPFTYLMYFFLCISIYMGIIQSFLQTWNTVPFPAKLHQIYGKYLYIANTVKLCHFTSKQP